MQTVADKIRELREREAKIKEMGGEKAVAAQHERGKLTARERLEYFFDPGTFRELDIFVKHRGTLFGLDKMDIPADGVITGYGLVNGRQVFAFSQDFTARAGTLGEMHSRKICKVMDLALKAGLKYVYIGNLPGNEAENTFCHACGKQIIARRGYMIGEVTMKDGHCGHCGAAIPGLWRAPRPA